MVLISATAICPLHQSHDKYVTDASVNPLSPEYSKLAIGPGLAKMYVVISKTLKAPVSPMMLYDVICCTPTILYDKKTAGVLNTMQLSCKTRFKAAKKQILAPPAYRPHQLFHVCQLVNVEQSSENCDDVIRTVQLAP